MNSKLSAEIKNILIVTAMKVETDALLNQTVTPFAKKTIRVNKSQVDVYHLEINGRNLFLVESGVGFVNSSIVISRMIDDFDINAIISFGVGGSLSSKLQIGDAVLSSSVIQHDAVFVTDSTVRHMAPGRLFVSLKEEERESAYIAASSDLIQLFSQASLPANKIFMGVIASGSSFVAGYNRKNDINTHLVDKALMVDMESAAIAQLSRDAQIPFIIIKTVADRLLESGEIENDYKSFLEAAANNTHSIFNLLLKTL